MASKHPGKVCTAFPERCALNFRKECTFASEYSKDALRLAGLDWNVVQEPIYTEFNEVVEGYKANVRDTDRKVLGVVSDRYKVVQNADAFSFTDELLGKGVRYETAGSL